MDSTNASSKSDDVMMLTIGSQKSTYYSYLSQFGQRNKEKYLKDIEGSGMSELNFGKNLGEISANFYIGKETEIIDIDYAKRIVYVSNQFPATPSVGYEESLIIPSWKVTNETDTILGQFCQKATTWFKGRQYIAWFAPGIPYQAGPWLLNGLPGLILRAADDKNQFLFDCFELNASDASTNVYKPYNETKIVSKSKFRELKRLYVQDYLTFTRQVQGKTITVTNTSGTTNPPKLRPYNPIDLSKE